MNDRKLQVFVSSTYTDLIEERQAAVEAILQISHIPAGMELFTAGDQSQWDVIKQWIDDSDVYLLILGGRYGSVDKADNKSYTQKEFEYALSIGKPLFSIVLSDIFLEDKIKGGANLNDVRESAYPAEYKSFKDDVMSKLVAIVQNKEMLQLAIIKTLATLEKRDDLIGWVRGNKSVDTALLAEQIAQLTKENAELRKFAGTTSVTYNGLTFDELNGLLVKEPLILHNVENVKNLKDFIFAIKPHKRLNHMPFYNAENAPLLINALKSLEQYRIINNLYNGFSYDIVFTEDGHNFYLKMLALRNSEI